MAEGDLVAPGDVIKVLVPRRGAPVDARERLMSSGTPTAPAAAAPAIAPPGPAAANGPAREANVAQVPRR